MYSPLKYLAGRKSNSPTFVLKDGSTSENRKRMYSLSMKYAASSERGKYGTSTTFTRRVSVLSNSPIDWVDGVIPLQVQSLNPLTVRFPGKSTVVSVTMLM